MKAIAIAAVVLGLIYVAYAQTCDQSIITDCYSPYVDCAFNANSSSPNYVAEICTCYGKWGACLTSKNCFTGATRSSFLSDCTQAGCTSQQCSSATSSGVSVVVLLGSLLFALYH